MTYFICVSLICLSAYVGRILTKTMVKRNKILLELDMLLEYFKNNISFSQTKLSDLVKQYEKYALDLNLFKSFFVIDESENIKLMFNHGSLKNGEKDLLKAYFSNFGNCDKETELKKLENILAYVKSIKRDSDEYRKKNEALVYKVCVAIGVVLSILII